MSKKNMPRIKGYKFDGNEIVVNYGLFRKERIPNTTENIKKLNLIMKNQMMNYPTVGQCQKEKKHTVLYTYISLFVAFGLSLLNAPIAIVAIPSLIGGFHLYNYLSNTYREYKALKHEFFFKHQAALNEGIRPDESNEETLAKAQNVSKRTLGAIMEEKNHTNKDIFDVNSIRKMSFNSLLNLRENLINLKKAQTVSSQVENAEEVAGPVLRK